MFNLGVIAAAARRTATAMLPTSIVLRRFGSGYRHQVRFEPNGVLSTTTQNNPSLTALGNDFWIKNSDRSAGVGSDFEVVIGPITNGPTPGIQPVGTHALDLARTFEWQWSSSSVGGNCTMTVRPKGQTSPSVSTTITFL